ncbi:MULTISPECIES: hypothetical protein [Desulfococcus]|jgi:multisubunit Na+/H+ antiporter MnhB subunit|uniref:Uncharacterized protein n=1 Tax=Desulfococcus multivorans DSM 2059 TaxID=1121405 RepID=S7U248_DESML|nr:hypothetical protein [Desulfococcus multivorans]AOY60406.1 conserved uncharacterized protein [Desulfococcus multivorans]AQV02503.1 hypothetical protein B2D07_18165 [Desulfococcus multivorans]EPR43075.1 hypothetical protein dsmv_1396 [Desulfococcus multivorans DSM 2059]MDX9818413.1 hypothetical protein [Desulfococcus multivorans]SJZ60718.1 hypothetical protein SAMN02745446_01102 [Desulfococcus multivorans DSM 2059]
MSGFQELIVIALVVFLIIFMPRVMPRKPEPRAGGTGFRKRLSGKMRLGIAVSAVYLAGAAAWFKPWEEEPIRFLYIGVGPVLAGWLACWVVAGFRGR